MSQQPLVRNYSSSRRRFDGFDETNERLDLLALDKDGNLVLIENKLDDSGRDVVWQALKYASYCSTLDKQQIVEIYQQYLNKYDAGKNAQALICEFLEEPDLGEVVINSKNKQRLMFVAAQFRKEVTATVLWLLGHNIPLQCFKATPYAMDDNLFLTPDVAEADPGAGHLRQHRHHSEQNWRSGISRLLQGGPGHDHRCHELPEGDHGRGYSPDGSNTK